MKYEFKPFYYEELTQDLALGWKLTFRVAEDYPTNTRRDVEIVDLGPKAHYKSRLASIDLAEGGAVRMHDIAGNFDSTQGPCALDLILYREVDEKPAERTAHGVAYLTEKGVVTLVRSCEAHLAGLEDNPALTPVPCTITLHASA
jgi:hypothetical protein